MTIETTVIMDRERMVRGRPARVGDEVTLNDRDAAYLVAAGHAHHKVREKADEEETKKGRRGRKKPAEDPK